MIPSRRRKWKERNPAQPREGTMVVPSCVLTSWQRVHAVDSLTTRAKSSNELTSVRRNFLLMRPVPCNSPFLFIIGFILLNNQVSDIQPPIAHYVGSLLYCCFNIVEDSNIILVVVDISGLSEGREVSETILDYIIFIWEDAVFCRCTCNVIVVFA